MIFNNWQNKVQMLKQRFQTKLDNFQLNIAVPLNEMIITVWKSFRYQWFFYTQLMPGLRSNIYPIKILYLLYGVKTLNAIKGMIP